MRSPPHCAPAIATSTPRASTATKPTSAQRSAAAASRAISNDEALQERVLREYAGQLAAITEWTRTTSSKAPDGPTLLADFVAGRRPHHAWVGFNSDIIQLLLEVLGEPLDSEALERVNAEWIDDLGGALREAGWQRDIWSLLSSVPPVPTSPDFPGSPTQDTNAAFLDADEVQNDRGGAGVDRHRL